MVSRGTADKGLHAPPSTKSPPIEFLLLFQGFQKTASWWKRKILCTLLKDMLNKHTLFSWLSVGPVSKHVFNTHNMIPLLAASDRSKECHACQGWFFIMAFMKKHLKGHSKSSRSKCIGFRMVLWIYLASGYMCWLIQMWWTGSSVTPVGSCRHPRRH